MRAAHVLEEEGTEGQRFARTHGLGPPHVVVKVLERASDDAAPLSPRARAAGRTKSKEKSFDCVTPMLGPPAANRLPVTFGASASVCTVLCELPAEVSPSLAIDGGVSLRYAF